ncbi:SCF ubiquitin ligase complex subunit cdc4 [Entophlyctis luteolus]|nr:SCF ubiquitin ligase complex subunit cdc4 [Entophlyctis luteolus]
MEPGDELCPAAAHAAAAPADAADPAALDPQSRPVRAARRPRRCSGGPAAAALAPPLPVDSDAYALGWRESLRPRAVHQPQQRLVPTPSLRRAAQFALAPHAVTTVRIALMETVVTTTTTKITEFSPMFFDDPKPLANLSPMDYPLANTPTPPALKKFCFDLNGVPTRLTELDVHEDALSDKSRHQTHVTASAAHTIEREKPKPVTSPATTSRHLQHHSQVLSSMNMPPPASIVDRVQTASPHKSIRKARDIRSSAIAPNQLQLHIDEQLSPHPPQSPPQTAGEPVFTLVAPVIADPIPSIPLTPFPDPALNNNLVPPVILLPQPEHMQEDPSNLPPSPTMSPTQTPQPLHHFHPVPSRQALSPSSRRVLQKMHSTSLPTSPTASANQSSGRVQIPHPLTTLPTIIQTYTNLPSQLQTYMLLQMLRRTPSSTLQFVSSLLLPALKRDLLTHLPVELAYSVLARLDVRTLCRCMRVCRSWAGIFGEFGVSTKNSSTTIAGGEISGIPASEGFTSGGAGIAVWKRRLMDEGWWSESDVKGILEKWVLWRRRIAGNTSFIDAPGAIGRVTKRLSVSSLVDDQEDGKGKAKLWIHGRASGDSLDSAKTAVVGLGLDAQDKFEGFQRCGESSTEHIIRPFSEFTDDADDDDDSSSTVDFSEYFNVPHTPELVKKSAEWMQSLDEFSTGGLPEDSELSFPASVPFHRPVVAKPVTLSKVRTRLRSYIDGLSKSELSRLALRIPNLYKNIYRRHYILRKNWAKGLYKTIQFPGSRATALMLSHAYSLILTKLSDDQSIHIYDTSSGRLRRKLVGHDGGVWALQYWGTALVSGSTDRTVRVWDMDTGLCTHLFEGHTSTVRCLMIVPPTKIATYPFGTNGRSGGVGFEPAFEPSQPLIVTGSRDATLRVWRLPNPKSGSFHVPNGAAGCVQVHGGNNSYDSVDENPYFMHVLAGHTNSVRAMAGHGRVLVSGSYDCTVRVWDLIEGECVYTFRGHREKVYSVGYNHELGRAVSGSLDACVKVWCTTTGVQLHSLEGHTSLVGLLELSTEYLVSAAADQSLRIWSPQTGSCLAHLHGHPAAITCFHHDPRLNRIVSGSDGGVKLWELSSAARGGALLANGGGGPGFEMRQGPNGPEPVCGRFARDLVTDVAGVWRVRMDERRLVCAVSREGGGTWFLVLDFGETAEHGKVVDAPGDGGLAEEEDDEEDEDDIGDEDAFDEDIPAEGEVGILFGNPAANAAEDHMEIQAPSEGYVPPNVFNIPHGFFAAGSDGIPVTSSSNGDRVSGVALLRLRDFSGVDRGLGSFSDSGNSLFRNGAIVENSGLTAQPYLGNSSSSNTGRPVGSDMFAGAGQLGDPGEFMQSGSSGAAAEWDPTLTSMLENAAIAQTREPQQSNRLWHSLLDDGAAGGSSNNSSSSMSQEHHSHFGGSI